MKKILVTGAGGFVGTYLIKRLLEMGESEVYGAVYQSTSDIQGLLDSSHIIEGDLTDPIFVENLIKTTSPNVVYHLAALSVVHNSQANALRVLSGNTAISYNLLDAVRLHAESARFMAICSANVYGAVQNTTIPVSESTPLRPLNPYAVSKISQEMLALQYFLAYGLDVVILRPFNHTGIGQTLDFVIPRLSAEYAKIERGETPAILEVGNISSIRDFTDVHDMVEAYILAAKSCVSGEIYNIGTGQGVSVAKILEILSSLTQVKVEIKSSQGLSRVADVPVLVADASKFIAATGWHPRISLETTISDILGYYRLTK